MARGINRVTLIGNIGSEPETHNFANGGSVTKITLATTETWKDKTSGEAREATEWHTVKFSNRLGEIVEEYCNKGSQIYIEGSIKTETWDKDGVKQYRTVIMAREMQMLGGTQSQAETKPASKPAATQQRNAPPAGPPPLPQDLDDDIPF